jgi:hypothetical protein
MHQHYRHHQYPVWFWIYLDRNVHHHLPQLDLWYQQVGIVDQENIVQVIVVKMMYPKCMFGTYSSGFLQLHPGVLIRSNRVKPSIGR